MAKLSCPDCGMSVESSSSTCPDCQARLKREISLAPLIIFTVIMIGIFLAGAVFFLSIV